MEFISTIKKLSKYSAFGLKSLDHFSVLKLWPQHADKCGRKKLGLDEYIISVHYTWLEFFVC